MQTTYQAGSWYILVAPGALIALPPDAPENLVKHLWASEQTVGDLAAVIDALADHAAGSFATMLPFAAVVFEGPDARIAVRGDVSVQATGSEGDESFSGANVTTWSERFVVNASRIVVNVGEASDDVSLPITGGIVRASSASACLEPAELTVADAAQPAAAQTAEPEAEEPEIEEPIEEPEPALISDPEAPDVEEAVVDEVVDEPADVPEHPITDVVPEASAPVDDAVDGATLLPTEVTYSSDIDEFEQLFGETIASPSEFVQPAMPPAPPTPAVQAASVPPVDGDHDGATISVAESRALRQSAPEADPEAPTAVLPVISGASGRVRVSTGQVVLLDRTVIIGRRPRSTRASGADLPHLVAVESPQQDISRSHLEIRPEGDTILAIDLNTTNGSTLLRPGVDPLRLHPGEQTLVLSGDVIDLGDGVTVAFEDLP